METEKLDEEYDPYKNQLSTQKRIKQSTIHTHEQQMQNRSDMCVSTSMEVNKK